MWLKRDQWNWKLSNGGGSDHMITTDPLPRECPGLKGSKHSMTGGVQLMIYLMWMWRVLFQTFITFWETSDLQESLDDN